MKKFVFIFLLLSLPALPVFAQKSKTPAKPAVKKNDVKKFDVKKPVVQKPAAKQTAAGKSPATEISDQDWAAVTDALNKENWTQAASLSQAALGKLKLDNDKKQLAQLRYFYLYATAGKVAEGKTTFADFEKTVKNFIGKEFMTPRRTVLADCAAKVNYVCAAKGGRQVLRVTATDKVATIHSFEYFKLTEKFDPQANDGKSAALAGILEKAETYSSKTNAKFIRLIFGDASVSVAPNL